MHKYRAKPTISLALQCRSVSLPEPVTEFRFAPPRRWRFDYAWPIEKLALEVDGGIWTQGRHTRGAGVEKDHEKLNTALVEGWRVLRVTPKSIGDGWALIWVERAIRGKIGGTGDVISAAQSLTRPRAMEARRHG